MEKHKVGDILQPYSRGIPLHPSVRAEDGITHAIEVMVLHDVTCIAVVKNSRPIGRIHLEDAFKQVGLTR